MQATFTSRLCALVALPACAGTFLSPAASSQSTALTLTPPPPVYSSGFGYTLGDLGDVDGDGVHDIVVGAPGDWTVAVEAGALHVYSGATASVLYTLYGPGPVSDFGLQITVVGDVDLDGRSDFIVQRPGFPGHSSIGDITLFSGATGQFLLNVVGSTLSSGNHGFGFDADEYGDFDHDGRADLLVSAPEGSPYNGTVYILSGATGAVLQSVSGTVNSMLGKDVTGLGDVDGDTVPDFAAYGKQGSLQNATVYSGATGNVLNAFNYLPGSPLRIDGRADFNGDGRRDLLVAQLETSIQIFDVLTSQALFTTILPPTCESQALCSQCAGFAADVKVIGDRDGDGIADIAEFNGRQQRWSILSSATGATQFQFSDAGPVMALAPTHDWNGDGKADLIVSYPYNGYAPRVVVATARNPVQGTPIALGDGTGAACPCGNAGQAGAGCANSSGAGATLRAKGSTSLAPDNLMLETTQIPFGAFSLLISGSSAQAGGNGIPFRDGLLAAGGAITRVRTQSASCPDGMTIGPGLRWPASWTAGNTYALQVWYRDTFGPCGQASNLTNGLSVSFTP